MEWAVIESISYWYQLCKRRVRRILSMKLIWQCGFVILSALVGTTFASDNGGLRANGNADANDGVSRGLWKTKFENVTLYYDPAYNPCGDNGGGGDGTHRELVADTGGDGDGGCKKYPKCVLHYEIEHYEPVKIVFDPEYINEVDHKVKCSMDYKPPKGTKLPIDVKVPAKHATWKGAEVTSAYVKWGLKSWSEKDSYRLDVVILTKPFETVIEVEPIICPGQKVEWKAIYEYDDMLDIHKCTLTYSVNKGAHVTIPLPIVIGGGETGEVKCIAHITPPENKDTLCLPIINEDITDSAYYIGLEDVQKATVDWKKDGLLKLVIVAAEPEPLKVTAKYTPHAKNDPPCIFSYYVGGAKITVKFKKEEVYETKYHDTAICKKKEHPKGGLELPIKLDPPTDQAVWVGETVRDFEVRWGDDKGNNHLEIRIKKRMSCPVIVEEVIRHASLKPKGLAISTSPQGRALAWLKSVADCLHNSEHQWIQSYALATIYYASNGEDWDSADCWVPSPEEGVKDLANACKPMPWEFVTCKGNTVIGLEPISNNLVGQLHPEIGLLTGLEIIDMNRNNLDGEIPGTLGRLKDLEFLDLSFNDFSGSISDEICDIIVNWNSLIVDPEVICPQGCCALSPAPTVAPTPAPTPPPIPPTTAPPPDPDAKYVSVEYLGLSDRLLDIVAQFGNTTFSSPVAVEPIDEEIIVVPNAPGAPDAALDEGPDINTMPDPILTFEGLSNADQGRTLSPPDPVGAVGPEHYVQMINVAFQIFLKDTGEEVIPPTNLNALFVGDQECFNGSGDPIVLYDQLEDRWLLTRFTTSCRGGPNAPPCYNCMAISTTSDPTGQYHRYRVPAQPDPAGTRGSVFPDYPKYSSWTDSYVLTTSDFGGFGYRAASVYAIEKAPMLTGQVPAARQFILPKAAWGPLIGDRYHLLSADIDGKQRPPPGSPIPVLSGQDDDFDEFGAVPFDAINVFDLSVDWSAPDEATLEFKQQLPVLESSSNVCGLFCRRDVPLPGGWSVDSFARLLFRVSYRNFCGYESLLAVRGGVERNGEGTPLGVRWFELRRQDGEYSIYQESTYSPDDGLYRWMPSIAQDKVGNIAVGYSVANATTFPGIRFAGRLAGDELNRMTLGEASLIEGSGTQSRSNRWGDYTSMNIDPIDDCTFYYTNQYYEAAPDGTTDRVTQWQTRIGKFVLPGCLH